MTIPTGSTAITDPTDPTHQATVDSSGALKVSATFSASSVAINDGTNTSNKLAVDSNGKIGISSMPSVTATNPSVGANGSATPTSSTEMGASDGTNLQPLQVESSSNKNLRVGLYNGANEASVSAGGAVKVDNSAVTQPVSAASLPLPSGASTSAKQPALGTAGSASTDVLTVQGIASMTALKVDGSAVTQPANISQWAGATPSVSNPVYASLALGSAVAAYGSNPSQTAASAADTSFKWGAGGTTTVNHISIQNNTAASIYYAFDQSSVTSGNAIYVLAAGQVAFWDRAVTTLHVSSAAQQNFGGQSGITIEGFA